MRRWALLIALFAGNVAIYRHCLGDIQADTPFLVLAYNDLGMHCMNQDFSELCVLPPANTLRAQVIDRSGEDPTIVTGPLNIRYSIVNNRTSTTKTNFWDYDQQLFGVDLPSNMGLFGFGLNGLMKPTAERDYIAQGIPVTQISDAGVDNPYQLASVQVYKNKVMVASTRTVVPVSWEMSCNQCHNTPGVSTAHDILAKHDRIHGTSLVNQKPVLCAKCHSDNALGAPGQAGISSLSSAMHLSHSGRMGNRGPLATCYSCHPGPVTKCFRDVHKAAGMTCQKCHESMTAVGNPARKPWIEEPRCGSCHNEPGHEYEQPGKLFRDSVGHNGVKCIACHGSPHAITPSLKYRDNLQAIYTQGTAGTISKCSVCHKEQPTEPFNHSRDD